MVMRWLVGCCSTAVSIALLFAGSLFAASINPGISRTARSVADQVPRFLEQRLGKNATLLIRQAISPRSGLEAANIKAGPKMATAIAAPLPSGTHANVDTASSAPSSVTKSPSKEISRSDVVWLFDERGGPSLFAASRNNGSATATGFIIDGENTSDVPLTDVQAVLIPDKNAGKLELVLTRSEQPADEPVQIIPSGAQFSLAYTFSKDLTGSSDSFVEKCGGVIFTFHYTRAGVHKAVIWYLSPSRLRTELHKAGALASLD
jgi:hypothetical protein